NIPSPLALDLERHIQDRQAEPDEYLLYPEHRGRRGTWPNYTEDVIWKSRFHPLSMSGVDKWWQRCRARAGLEHIQLHEIRHTARTHSPGGGPDLAGTQHFIRHETPATTAKTYIHLDRVKAVAEVQKTMRDPLADG